jgi:hypothetical protein
MKDNNMEGPKPIDDRPPYPETLRDFYNIITKAFPNNNHSEAKFLEATMEILSNGSEWLRTMSKRERIKALGPNGLDYEFGAGSLSDFWHVAALYLKNLNVSEKEIDTKLHKIQWDGFKS